MSLKKEYDLNSFCQLADNASTESSFEMKEEEFLVDIHFKLECPYQSTQFPLIFHCQDDTQQHHDNHMEETRDPLELGVSNVYSELSKLNEAQANIDIKLEYPYRSPELSLELHQEDDEQNDDLLETTRDPLECGQPFATVCQQKHPETTPHVSKRILGEPKFSCDICNNSYHFKRSLQRHKIKVHPGHKPQDEYSNRLFSCPICQQSFIGPINYKNHIQTNHRSTNTTQSGRLQTRPKWQAKQPCTCSICGKIYRLPSQLIRHMRIHTGEKPYSCKSCDQKFRTVWELKRHNIRRHLKNQLHSNPLKLFKCRICGKDDFVLFGSLHEHRKRAHRHIPYDNEKEKPFACGICGKPYFLREGALICAILGHDPSKLRKQMFKVRCPECPEDEVFGFHNVLALRRHWDKEHADKPLPSRFNLGDKDLKDKLPNCTIDKLKSEDVRKNGPLNLVQVENEGPLYVELNLLDIPENERFYKNVKVAKVKKVEKNVEHICTICGLKLKRGYYLKRHMKRVHDPSKTYGIRAICECIVCGLKFGTATMLTRHFKKVHVTKGRRGRKRKVDGPEKKKKEKDWKGRGKCYDAVTGHGIDKNGKRMRGRPRKIITNAMETVKVEPGTEMEANCEKDIGIGENCVNIYEQGKVQAILNFQSVTVHLTRIELND